MLVLLRSIPNGYMVQECPRRRMQDLQRPISENGRLPVETPSGIPVGVSTLQIDPECREPPLGVSRGDIFFFIKSIFSLRLSEGGAYDTPDQSGVSERGREFPAASRQANGHLSRGRGSLGGGYLKWGEKGLSTLQTGPECRKPPLGVSRGAFTARMHPSTWTPHTLSGSRIAARIQHRKHLLPYGIQDECVSRVS